MVLLLGEERRGGEKGRRRGEVGVRGTAGQTKRGGEEM